MPIHKDACDDCFYRSRNPGECGNCDGEKFGVGSNFESLLDEVDYKEKFYKDSLPIQLAILRQEEARIIGSKNKALAKVRAIIKDFEEEIGDEIQD